MTIIHTKSFALACRCEGDPDSPRAALLIPGRLDTKDYINFVHHSTLLATKGFYVVTFDYPGTWESPGHNIPYTTTIYIQVVQELIEKLGNRPTLLVGHSRGGQTAILAGCQHPSVIGITAINSSFGPPSPPKSEKIKDGFVKTTRDMPPGDRRTDERKELQLSTEYWEDGEKYDARKVLPNCTKPKLIIHGTRDEFQDIAEVQEIFNQAADPKFFQPIESDHDYRLYPEFIQRVNTNLEDFLNHLD